MRFGHVEIFVRDPLRARAFYEQVLGFQVVDVQAGKFVWMRLGQSEILLRPGTGTVRPDTYQTSPQAIVLYADDLPAMMAELEERGLVFAGNDGSERCPTFTDPDGNWFQLVDPRHT